MIYIKKVSHPSNPATVARRCIRDDPQQPREDTEIGHDGGFLERLSRDISMLLHFFRVNIQIS